MEKVDTIAAWQARDAEFEKRFEKSQSLNLRHLLGKLFGKHAPPDLNDYRDHLLKGNAVGALPIEGLTQMPDLLQKFAPEDHERLARTKGEHEMRSESARRITAKITMDVLAGKIPIFGEEHNEQ